MLNVQSGCCKPPMYCGLTRENGSTWTVPEKGPAVQESDCTTFSNEQDQLCYDCKSCKGGVLDHVRKEWRFLSVLNSCVLVVILVVFCIGCCVRKNYRYDQYMRYRNGYAHSWIINWSYIRVAKWQLAFNFQREVLVGYMWKYYILENWELDFFS